MRIWGLSLFVCLLFIGACAPLAQLDESREAPSTALPKDNPFDDQIPDSPLEEVISGGPHSSAEPGAESADPAKPDSGLAQASQTEHELSLELRGSGDELKEWGSYQMPEPVTLALPETIFVKSEYEKKRRIVLKLDDEHECEYLSSGNSNSSQESNYILDKCSSGFDYRRVLVSKNIRVKVKGSKKEIYLSAVLRILN